MRECECVSYKLVELSVTMSASVRARVRVCQKSVCSACIKRVCGKNIGTFFSEF